jgi:hypothetical protein
MPVAAAPRSGALHGFKQLRGRLVGAGVSNQIALVGEVAALAPGPRRCD